MKNKKTSIVVAIIILLIVISLILPVTMFEQQAVAPTPEMAPRNDIADPNLASSTSNTGEDLSDLIIVTSPTKGASVTSPISITGKARGGWYFEATFPFELVDSVTKAKIAEGYAQAQGEWMTNNFVPFSATLSYPKPAAPREAILIISNSNPSGLAANAKSVSIPLTLK